MQVPDVIGALNPFLRGWGDDFPTGDAAKRCRPIDQHVTRRPGRLLIKQRGRSLHAAQAEGWTEPGPTTRVALS